MNKYTKNTCSPKRGFGSGVKSQHTNGDNMDDGNQRLRRIISGENDFPSPQFERQYRFLKALLISAMRERQGRHNINLAVASDVAWKMAEELPDGVTLACEGGPDGPNDNPPRWIQALFWVCIILAEAFLIYLALSL